MLIMIRSENDLKRMSTERIIHTTISHYKILTLRARCLKGFLCKLHYKSDDP